MFIVDLMAAIPAHRTLGAGVHPRTPPLALEFDSGIETPRRGSGPGEIIIEPGRGARPHQQFADLLFPTPSGRIEVASDRFLAAGLSREPRPDVEPLPTDGALRVLSPASKWLMNSSFGNEPKVSRRFERLAAWMHPQDTGRLGLEDGDRVEIHNATGAVQARVTASDVVPPGVVLMHKSSRPKLAADGVNVNALFDGTKTDTAESTAVHSVVARVRRAGDAAAAEE
jgi:anaerobic selenocysteine-containing dehydrogenase